MIKIANTIRNGINIHILILRIYSIVANIHHSAKAQLSHINIFAGLILKNMNAIKHAIKIQIIVVAKYAPLKNITIVNKNRTILINQPANQSKPSVILIAFTILIVIKNVKTGANNQISILPAIGQRFI